MISKIDLSEQNVDMKFFVAKMVLIELAQNTTSIVGKMPYGKLEKYYETNWKRKKEAEPLYNGSEIVPPKCGLGNCVYGF